MRRNRASCFQNEENTLSSAMKKFTADPEDAYKILGEKEKLISVYVLTCHMDLWAMLSPVLTCSQSMHCGNGS